MISTNREQKVKRPRKGKHETRRTGLTLNGDITGTTTKGVTALRHRAKQNGHLLATTPKNLGVQKIQHGNELKTSSPKGRQESTRLPPMCPGFDFRTQRHMRVEFVVGSRPCSEGFSPGCPVFLPPQKSTFLNSNSIGNSRATGLSI